MSERSFIVERGIDVARQEKARGRVQALVASLVASEDADFIRELRDGLGEALGISKTPRGTRGGKKVQARRAAQKHAEAHAMFGKVGQ